MRTVKTLKFKELEILLENIQKPGRYINKEIGTSSKNLSIIKDPSGIIFAALVFPDIYEVGMSNMGLQILYDIINRSSYFTAERVYSPWLDFEERLREQKVKLFSLENRIFLDCFDIIGFSAQHEMLYTNILNILNLGEIEIITEKRGKNFPLVCAGGPATVNPQPLSRFMDFMVIGEAEEVIVPILEKVKAYKDNCRDKKWFLKEIRKIDGVYIPGLYKFYYFKDGRIRNIEPDYKVKKAVVSDLDKFDIVTRPIIPSIKIIHDRFSVEIMRGCRRGCRFCQAGITCRPVRQRNAVSLIKQSIKGIRNTGYDEISFLSPSTADYKDINYLVNGVLSNLKTENLSISLPSLRLDSFNIDIAKLIGSGRKTGLTFAPEAGSQRMRDIINKGITEKEMIECAGIAFKKGWERIKLYFMIGLPFEKYTDIEQIILLVKKIIYTAKDILPRQKLKRFKVNVSINAFNPKPFTAFQWVAQNSVKTLKEKFDYIIKNLPRRDVKLSWANPYRSKVECALSRGNIITGKVIENAWEAGAKFDNWTDCFKFDAWEEGFRKTGADIDFYTTREIPEDEILPWDIVDIGIKKQFLLKEYKKSIKSSELQD